MQRNELTGHGVGRNKFETTSKPVVGACVCAAVGSIFFVFSKI